MLIVVRHAMPAITPSEPPETWHLGDEGRSAAIALAHALPSGAYLVASSEPKARETLEPGGPVVADARFNEVSREGEPFGGDFRALRLAYVGGVDHPRWEPRADVSTRFAGGVATHLTEAAGRPLVVATHGMALTLWLTETIGLPDPAAFWADLRLPDAFVVDSAARQVTRLSGV